MVWIEESDCRKWSGTKQQQCFWRQQHRLQAERTQSRVAVGKSHFTLGDHRKGIPIIFVRHQNLIRLTTHDLGTGTRPSSEGSCITKYEPVSDLCRDCTTYVRPCSAFDTIQPAKIHSRPVDAPARVRVSFHFSCLTFLV